MTVFDPDKIPLKYRLGVYKKNPLYPAAALDVLFDICVWLSLQVKSVESSYNEMPVKSLRLLYKNINSEKINNYLVELSKLGYIKVVIEKKVIQIISNPWI